MVELIKKAIKWIIVILIIILGISILIKASNSNKTKNVNKPLSTPVKTIKKNNNTEKEEVEDEEESISGEEVDTPDTASSNVLEVVIGIILLSGSTYYIVKNRLVEE